jgi:hypothetical protein
VPTAECLTLPMDVVSRAEFPYAVALTDQWGITTYDLFSDRLTANLWYDIAREVLSDLSATAVAMYVALDARGEWENHPAVPGWRKVAFFNLH